MSLLCSSRSVVATNVRLQVEGPSGELEKNVHVQLSMIENDEVTPNYRLRAHVGGAICGDLRALGYYRPTIEFGLRPPLKKGWQVLIIKVMPGVPVLTGGTGMVLCGSMRIDKGYLRLPDTRPAIGAILSQGDYEDLKKPLASITLCEGHSDSESAKAQLDTAFGLYKAFWDTGYNSGERHRFGYATLEGS